MTLILLCLQQTKDLKCATRLLSEKFEMMSEPKKAIVPELGFGGLMHIPPMNVPHKLLKELANSFNLDKNKLDISYGLFKVKPKIIGAALGLNASRDLFPDKVSYKKLSEENKLIFRRFQGKTLKHLIDEMMNISVDNDHDRLMFKRIFILYIQTAFLLPTTINKGIVKKAETKKKLKELKKKRKERKKEKKNKKEESKFIREVFFTNDCLPSRMESRKRKQILEYSTSESESKSNDE
ncbi:hypothetical protein Ahy_B04g069928 [Arachis hypogaea]|uniref:Uncharacterized protein n=1 Tax=Arachis hypogaea TaxID=3818 RepID=A0A444ZDX9_ARAHY|nr:hypothetical protein Ahy_B04g069928 [Arachis hypogaea]